MPWTMALRVAGLCRVEGFKPQDPINPKSWQGRIWRASMASKAGVLGVLFPPGPYKTYLFRAPCHDFFMQILKKVEVICGLGRAWGVSGFLGVPGLSF